MASQPLVPMSPMESIESIGTLEPIPLPQEDNNLFIYEWDIFEKSLEWAYQDSLDWVSDSVLSTSPSSPADSSLDSFSPHPNSHSRQPQSTFTSPTSNPKLPLPQQPASKTSKPRRRQQSPESRARRRSQNREAQRAFRCRKQQQMEKIEVELRKMKGRYEGLAEKYENLSKLYMDLLKQRGGVGEESELLEEKAMETTLLKDWIMDDVRLEGQWDRTQMSGQEVDVNELLFGLGMGTVGVSVMKEL